MSAWDELKPVLRRLSAQRPRPLSTSPGLDGAGDKQPPFVIDLAPWAVEAAPELHQRFGNDVELTVGSLRYPAREVPPGIVASPGPADLPLLDPEQVTVRLDGPAVVASGHTLEHGLLLRNLTGTELQIATNGGLTATVTDPRTGELVGGFTGWQASPLVIFRIAPGATARIPLLIGTASFVSRLGYAVPPGEWQMQAPVTLGTEPREAPVRTTGPLPLTVTG